MPDDILLSTSELGTTEVDTSLPQLETVDVFQFTPADAPSEEPITEELIVLLPPEIIETPPVEMIWMIPFDQAGGGSAFPDSAYAYYAGLWANDPELLAMFQHVPITDYFAGV